MIKRTPDIDAICMAMVELYKEQLKNDGAYASGNLDASITYDLVEEDGRITLYFIMPQYSMYSPENEYETKVPKADGAHPYKYAHPSAKMIASIDKWIYDKNLQLNPYAVAKKIMVDGWKNEPRENFKKAKESATMEELKEELAKEIRNQLIEQHKEEIRQFIRSIFK